MRILGIETSCDETAAAVVESSTEGTSVKLLSNVVASSMALHSQTGGIIPEVAARNQIHYIIPVISEALELAGILPSPQSTPYGQEKMEAIPNIDAIAITYGPGLIGSLLVGVETAKTLSHIWNKPLIPVNHLYGHLYANFVSGNPKYEIPNPKPLELPEFPAIGLIVSGAHTDLVLMKNVRDIVWLGGTRDDAAGEAFDKIGRLLGFPYPSGAAIENAAKKGDSKKYNFPRPLKYDKAYDFSFSGLKTAALREAQKFTLNTSNGYPELVSDSFSNNINNLARGTQDAIIDVLVYKTLKAGEEFGVKSILLGGGVAANQTLRDELKIQSLKLKIKIFVPQKSLCTDNAAMIAAAGFFHQEKALWYQVAANPGLYFD